MHQPCCLKWTFIRKNTRYAQCSLRAAPGQLWSLQCANKMKLVRQWNLFPFQLLSTLMCSWSKINSHLLTAITVLQFFSFFVWVLLVWVVFVDNFSNQEVFLLMQGKYFPVDKLVLTLLCKCIFSFTLFPPPLAGKGICSGRGNEGCQGDAKESKTNQSSSGLSSSMKMPHGHPLVSKRVLFGKPQNPQKQVD